MAYLQRVKKSVEKIPPASPDQDIQLRGWIERGIVGSSMGYANLLSPNAMSCGVLPAMDVNGEVSCACAQFLSWRKCIEFLEVLNVTVQRESPKTSSGS